MIPPTKTSVQYAFKYKVKKALAGLLETLKLLKLFSCEKQVQNIDHAWKIHTMISRSSTQKKQWYFVVGPVSNSKLFPEDNINMKNV